LKTNRRKIEDFLRDAVKSMEFFGSETLIFTLFRGRHIFFRG